MHRFFVRPEVVVGEQVSIDGELAHQLINVLRLAQGDRVLLLDDSGWEYQVELGRFDAKRIAGRVLQKGPSRGEPATSIVLYQGLLKANKFEYVLQKGTEVGIAAFVPLICRRSVPDISAESVRSKVARWRKIVQEAAEQSGRGRLPELREPCSFEEAVGVQGMFLLLWEGEGETGLKEALRRHAPGGPVGLFVGPEGGFTAEEVALARAQGGVAVTLGKRTLRAETAGLVAASIVLFERGELGG